MFGNITFLAYGSLMDQTTAKRLFPSATNFRIVEVKGYRRIFNVVHIRGIRNEIIAADAVEISSAAAQKHNAYTLKVVAFNISMLDFKSLFDARKEYKFVQANHRDPETGLTGTGLICEETDDYSFRSKSYPLTDVYEQEIGQYYAGDLWRDDILPSRAYVHFCLDAAAQWGQAVFDNFLDATVLADCKTPLRKYLKKIRS